MSNQRTTDTFDEAMNEAIRAEVEGDGGAGERLAARRTTYLWDRCPETLPRFVYDARARSVYWNRDFPACRAKGRSNAECLLDPGHAGDHYGNGFDTYGPVGPRRWPRKRPVSSEPSLTTDRHTGD